MAHQAAEPAQCVVCMEDMPTWWPDCLPTSRDEVPRFFSRSERFARWLFEQKRNDLGAHVTLLVTWREAKPCVNIVQALLSGQTANLRPDNKRLTPLAEDGTKGVQEPVSPLFGRMVVLAESNQEARANAWARRGAGSHGLDVHVVGCFKDLLAMSIREGFGAVLAEAFGTRFAQMKPCDDIISKAVMEADLTEERSTRKPLAECLRAVGPPPGLVPRPPPGLEHLPLLGKPLVQTSPVGGSEHLAAMPPSALPLFSPWPARPAVLSTAPVGWRMNGR